jgi:two-component system, chemotaxis family, sensor kinase CheA
MSAADAEFLGIFRDEANERLDSIVATLLAVERGGAGADAVDGLFRDAHTIKGAAGMLELDAVHALAHAVEDVLAAARDAGSLPTRLVPPLLAAADALRAQIERDEPVPAGLRAELDAAKASFAAGVVETVAEPAPEPAPVLVSVAAAEDRSIRVPAPKLDRLIELVGETVVHRQRLAHATAGIDAAERDALAGELDLGDRLLEALQEAALDTRTLPLQTLAGPLARAVRDAATAAGTDVELVVNGGEIELDRVVLEGLSDPLVHVLRNAVAHGIEPRAERLAAGKPSQGQIVVAAEQRGALVAVTVADDGRGVSRKVLAAVAPGSSLVDVLTRAGFSTNGGVSGLAGRGVGLDAVKASVEALRGELEIESAPGAGTVVTLLLPTTLALLDVLLVERGPHVFGLPLPSVQEAVAVTKTLMLTGTTAIELRGEPVPLADLADLVGGDAPPPPSSSPALVVSASGRRVAAVCDRLLGEEQVVVKDLGPLLRTTAGYLGAAILGNGRIALLLDPAALVRARRRDAARTSRAAPQTVTVPKLLVVEDSFTVRELQRSILEAAGYRVETARNGRDALERLKGDRSFSLVVTDVEMPELDGIELTRAIRAEPDLSSLPVIVVTTRGSEEDRARGFDAGADAYMTKQSYDQQALLGSVARLVAA